MTDTAFLPTDYGYIDRNLERVRWRIAEVCRAVGRDPAEITLLAAIKSADVGEINHLRHLGVTHLGENRVQQLRERYDRLDKDGTTLHFIGSLQTNKVKYIIDKVDMVESLDSLNLAMELERQAERHDRVTDVLVEINSGRELNKGGVLPEEAASFVRELRSFEHLRLRGFMTMAARGDETSYRRMFGETRRLAQELWAGVGSTDTPMVLSMGMSESYLYAAAEGATQVRVGRALFAREAIPPNINEKHY